MKKIILITAIAIAAVSNSVQAQDVDFGLKGGLNITNFTGGDADRNNLFDFHIGGFAEFKVSDKFSIQPELLYSRQGSEAENVISIEVDYLAIPVMAKYYLSDKFSIEAGPQASFLISDKAVFVDSDLPDAETDAQSFDFGLNVGVGYELSSHLFLQARYNIAITPIIESPDIKNSVFQLSLGYKF